MKKAYDLFMSTKIKPWMFALFAIVFDEVLLHFWVPGEFIPLRFLTVLLFAISLSAFTAFICSIFRSTFVNRILVIVFTGIYGVLTIAEFLIQNAFKNFMSLSSIFIGFGGVAEGFSGNVFTLILANWWRIIIIALPIVIYGFMSHRGCRDEQPHHNTIRISLAVASVVLFIGAHLFAHYVSPDRNVYSKEYEFNSAFTGFGMFTALRLDIEDIVIGDEEAGEFDNVEVITPVEPPEPEPIVYGENKMDIDFAALAESTGSSTLKSLHSYVAGLTPSKQNEYTGIFKGKNLIMITAEAFSSEVIDPVMTPTLYRLANKGIKFTDYYQPDWGGSTTGGEYTNLTGLAPSGSVRSMQQTPGKNMYFTLGNQLRRLNYTSFAYHNNSYTYYSRNKTHENIGYDKFIGMGNGMEKGVKNCWPQSDLEMIDFTITDYINKQPFSVYYMTVSGHCGYSRNGNMMSYRNFSVYKDMDASETIKCYHAANYELEKALTSLVSQLEKAGIADDTVIVLGTDHYPYGLDKSAAWGNDESYLDELYGYKVENCKQRDHSTLIIWSGCIEDKNIVVDTPVYSLDIVPTVSNLFGMEFDSRLLVGRDVFSDAEPIVMWSNRSWLTTEGFYNAKTKTFTPATEGAAVDNDYIKRISSIVSNKLQFSKKVLANDYYGVLFNKK